MTIDGKLGAVGWSDETVRGHGHDPVILSGALKANQGVLPQGLILTRAAGEFVPYGEVSNEALATGNAALKDFAGTLSKSPVEPGTVEITDGVETFTDDCFGRLKGSAGGTGSIDYSTGDYLVTFNAAVAEGAHITGDYTTAIDGVLEETVNTANSTSANYIGHGSVRLDALKVGAVAKAAPAEALLMRLIEKGIYPN